MYKCIHLFIGPKVALFLYTIFFQPKADVSFLDSTPACFTGYLTTNNHFPFYCQHIIYVQLHFLHFGSVYATLWDIKNNFSVKKPFREEMIP